MTYNYNKYRLKDAITTLTHLGHSYNIIISVIEKLEKEIGNNEEALIEALEDYYYGE